MLRGCHPLREFTFVALLVVIVTIAVQFYFVDCFTEVQHCDELNFREEYRVRSTEF